MPGFVYANHRENQKGWILEIAEDLFIHKGIANVTIADVAKASRLTRATIYKYFSNKEQMALEIFNMISKGWIDRNERDVWSAAGNGYERIHKFVTSHFEYLIQNPREARFIAEFNYLYAKEWPAEMALKLFSKTLEVDRQRILDCIRQGQQDGSLRGDIAAELVLAAIFNFNSGMLNRLGEMGAKVEVEYGLSVQIIFEQVCRVFLDGLKSSDRFL